MRNQLLKKQSHKKELPDWDKEGCMKLACTIARVRSHRYCQAYSSYLEALYSGDQSLAKSFKGRLAYAERKLRGPITMLEDDEIKALQDRVKRGEIPNSEWGY